MCHVMRTTKVQISLRISAVLISTIVVRCLDSTTPLVVIFEISTLQLASVAEQACFESDLSGRKSLKTHFRVIWLLCSP